MSITQLTLDLLFVSKVRVKSLSYFIMHADKEIHLRGMVRELDEEINAVRRELTRLEDAKLVIAETKGNRRYFKLNFSHPFVPELMGIFHKSFGLGGTFLENLKKIGEVEFAFLTPTYTKGIQFTSQPIDFVVVGAIDLQALGEVVKRIEYETNNEIHYMVMKSSEFILRKRRREQLIIDILMQNNVLLVGEYDALVKI